MKNFDKFLLFTYISYISIFILIFISGITGVFAASYNVDNFTAQIYDNVNGTLTSKNTYKETDFYYSLDVNYTSYSSGGAWGVSSPIPLIQGHTYSMTVDPTVIGCGFTILSNVNRLGIGTSLSNAVTSYQNNTNVNEKFSQAVSNSKYLQFVFTPTINASYIVFPFSTTSSCQGRESQLSSITIEDLGESGISQEQINISLSNQTNEINNSIQNSTDTIINNQNQNNEELKDTINENFNSCRDSYNLLYTPYTVNNKLTDTAIRDDYFAALNYYATLQAGKTYTFSVETDGQWGSTTGSDTVEVLLLKGPNYSYYITMTSNPFTFTPIESGDFYIRYDINQNTKTHSFWNFQVVEGSSAKPWEQAGVQVCQNKIDETNDKLDNLNSSLNNSNSSGATNDASNFFSNFTTDTFGLTSIITAPLSLINTLTSSSCSTLNLPIPYLDNKYLELPCMSSIYTKYFGAFFNIYQTITFGIVAYWVIVRIFNQVKDFKNPDHDEIEVLDL